MERADVVVIGGGIAGTSCAAHLAGAGRRVILLEREVVAAAASGRNSGVVQHPFDPVLVDLYRDSVDLYRQLALASEGAFQLPAEPSGLLSVTHDPEVAQRLAVDVALRYPGLAPRYLDPDEVRRVEPVLAPGVAACRSAIGYPVAPAAATRAYASWARALGVDIREGSDARLVVGDDRIVGVRLGDDTVLRAPSVVVAAGPWTPGIVDPGGTWRPIRPLWGVVVSMVLDRPPRHVLEEAEIDIEPSEPEVASGERAFSLITADRVSSLGSTFLEHEPDPLAIVPDIVARGATFVPAVGMAATGSVRACARPASADGRPLIGRIPWVEGLWVVAGHGPWGISTGPASGRLLADLITGVVQAPPTALDPARFGASPAG